MKNLYFKYCFIIFIQLLFGFNLFGQYAQSGSKLVGSGGIFTSKSIGGGNFNYYSVNQGWSVDLSGDGKTAIVGGFEDNGEIGAAWIFTSAGGNWTQVGQKLIGSGAVDPAEQGWAVSISGDGKTALIGGPLDNNFTGATWVFTLGGGNWSQSGQKLVGSGVSGGEAIQGWSVSLSDDGQTALVGGYADSGSVGAAWVFTSAGGNWSQMGKKLVGTGGDYGAYMGWSVCLSGDGKTAIIGGEKANNYIGAAWIFTLSGGNWTQVGEKLVGASYVGSAFQGNSVGLSGDGKTAIIGGTGDNNNIGAAWIFSYSNGTYAQVGNKLVGTDGQGTTIYQGQSVAISADGQTAVVGGRHDGSTGATWVYTFTGGNWTQVGSKLVGLDGTNTASGSDQGASVSISDDGQTILIGGDQDEGGYGTAWVFSNSSTSNITAIEKTEPVLSNGISIYPNPSTHSFSIKSLEDYPYAIIDVQGNTLESGNTSNSPVGSKLSSGLYQMKVNNQVFKIVKIE